MAAEITFGQYLRRLRRRRNESLTSIEKALRIDRSQMSRWELDKVAPRSDSYDTILRLDKYLGAHGELLRLSGLAGSDDPVSEEAHLRLAVLSTGSLTDTQKRSLLDMIDFLLHQAAQEDDAADASDSPSSET